MSTAPAGNAVSASAVAARLATDAAAARDLLDKTRGSIRSGLRRGVSAYESGDHWTVAIHFAEPPNQTAVRALVALASGAEAANALTFEKLAAKDWVRASLAGLTPVEAGRFVVHGAHDRVAHPHQPHRDRDRGGAGLRYRPSRHHARMPAGARPDHQIAEAETCPRYRHRNWRTGNCGSKGAACSACSPATSMRARSRRARDNARHNHARAVTVIQAAGLGAQKFRERAPFDLVLANILLGPLQRMATPVARLLAPGARVVLSGLLATQANAALSAYRAQGLALERRIVLDGWATLVLRAPSLPSPTSGRGKRM